MKKILIFCLIGMFSLSHLSAQERTLIVVQLPREITDAKSFSIQKVDGVCQIGHNHFDRLASEEQILEMQPYFHSDPRFVEREREMNMDLFYKIWVPASKSSQQVCQRFKDELGALSAEVELPIPLNEKTPNDNSYWRQWYLKNTSSNQIDIKMENAWNIHTGDPRVVVAVIDGSVDPYHEDLEPNLWHNPEEIPENGIDDDGNGYIDDEWGWNFRDNNNYPGHSGPDDSHGTHVAGIVAARSHNSSGIAGVAGGWGDQAGTALMVFRAGYIDPADGQGYVSHGYEALKYAADNGAAIAQCSWGGPGNSSVGRQAVSYFTRYGGGDAMTGGLVIAAAGNENTDRVSFPAGYPDVLSVSALDRYGERAGFSNYGSWVSIGAPGVGIYSSIPDDSYGSMDGTSMACPVVSGVAALALAVTIDLPKDKKTPEWLWYLLVDHANDGNPNSNTTGPHLDAEATLAAAKRLADVSNRNHKNIPKMQLAPNPSSDRIQISGFPNVQWNVSILSTTGQMLHSFVFSGDQKEFSIEHLKPGTYVLLMTSDQETQYSNWFVKL